MEKVVEKKSLRQQVFDWNGWEVEFFESEDGNLSMTVYEKGKPIEDEDARCIDILITEDLKVHFG